MIGAVKGLYISWLCNSRHCAWIDMRIQTDEYTKPSSQVLAVEVNANKRLGHWDVAGAATRSESGSCRHHGNSSPQYDMAPSGDINC